MKRFKILNEWKPYSHQIKPFNFIIIETSMESRQHNRKDIKPTIPYLKDYSMAPYKEFIDYHSGEVMKGARYWKPMDVIFQEYLDHPESKFDGHTGILQRKHILVSQIRYIGKESNRLEETDVMGLGQDGYEVYGSNPIGIDLNDPEVIKHMTPKMAKMWGISRGRLNYIKI